MTAPLLVRYRQDASGHWTATVPGMLGVITQAETLPQTYERLRKLLALWRDDAPTCELRAEIVGVEVKDPAIRRFIGMDPL